LRAVNKHSKLPRNSGRSCGIPWLNIPLPHFRNSAYDRSADIIGYAAAKGAIMIWMKGLAKQLAKKGIRMNAAGPGLVWTAPQVTGGQKPEKLAHFRANAPMGSPGQPAGLAPLYIQLVSAEPAFSAGQVFGAAGGRGGL
jgi:NAD(P)-dependent dehydrogenase (short-subunit alcohol dehydrogenase family)